MTAIKAPTATTVLKEASREMVHQSAGDLAGYLLDRIGPRDTAVGLGLSDARQIKAWRDKHASPRESAVADRLTLLAQIVRAIEIAYSAETAAAFLRSANPDLDDQPPLLVLADGDPLGVGRPLLRAVRSFLEP